MPILLLLLLLPPLAAGDPQAILLNLGCSQYNATNPSFPSTLNATFTDLRSQLGSNSSFATAEQPRAASPVYALFLCRPYLSPADCLVCFSAAVDKIRTCGRANGARAIYDGCFLRYETAPFFDQATLPGNVAICGNRTDNATGFAAEVQSLMTDLSLATPRVDGFFAAAERGGVYGVAQCVRTVSESGCNDCLAVALGNVKGCPPNADGRAVDAGCFMRYSDSNFFGSYQTVDLATLLASSSGGSRDNGSVIGGVVGGVGGLLLVGLVLFLWRRRGRRSKITRRGIESDLVF